MASKKIPNAGRRINVSRVPMTDEDRNTSGESILDRDPLILRAADSEVTSLANRQPLERAEIDHTELDVFVIDEKTRLPIGRPWLFVAIDVFTNMILGHYLKGARVHVL